MSSSRTERGHLRNTESPKIVTTSWDDGARTDLRLAELLRSKGVRGTFYIPIKHRESALDRAELRGLSNDGFEIGAHGFSHKPLCNLSQQELVQEVGSCKPALEDIIGRQVRMFCYPWGRFDARVTRTVRQCGFRGARTVRMLAIRKDFDSFEMPTTLQIFRHSQLTYLKNAARSGKIESWQRCLFQMPRLGNWLELGKRLFEEALENGGVWHLYGHSWELEQHGLWGDLKEILDYVAGRENVEYVSNSELLTDASDSSPFQKEIR